MVVGRLRTRSFETSEGEKRTVAEVDADEVAAALKFHTAKLTKATTAAGGNGGARRAAAQDEPPF